MEANANKRIAKNAIFLYIRMGILMLVSLYTSRVVLANLGVNDYGIYNVVGSFILAFTFIQAPVGAAIQRFLNFELGKDNVERVNVIMNQSLAIYSFLSIVLFIIIEVAGVWYISNKMVVPLDRLNATKFTFQLALVSLVFSLIRSPYDALIVAHERMSYYAYIGIIEALLKLANAISLALLPFDSLIVYSINQLVITLTITFLMLMFCRRNYLAEVRIHRVRDRRSLFELLSFSGWSLFSGVASMTATHGVNILINAFFGVTVNAAIGIANQINSIVNQFVVNFQKAFNPQIVKLCAVEDYKQMGKLVSRSSKFSYLLLFFLVCPVFFNLDFLLGIWLKDVPPGTVDFCHFLLIWQLLESLMGPMWTGITATGRIKVYHLTMNPIILSVIVLSYFALKLGAPAYSVVVVKVIVDVVLIIVRLLFCKHMIQFDVRDYIKKTIAPITIVSLIGIFIYISLSLVISNNLYYFFGASTVFVIVYLFSVLFIGFDSQERNALISYAKSKLHSR